MTGWNWNGEEMCWRHAPDQYGAIHFHDDDVYDAGWEVDVSLTVPKNLKSGLYAARLRCGEGDDNDSVIARVIGDDDDDDDASITSSNIPKSGRKRRKFVA